MLYAVMMDDENSVAASHSGQLVVIHQVLQCVWSSACACLCRGYMSNKYSFWNNFSVLFHM